MQGIPLPTSSRRTYYVVALKKTCWSVWTILVARETVQMTTLRMLESSAMVHYASHKKAADYCIDVVHYVYPYGYVCRSVCFRTECARYVCT